jgi:hypothetical protein
MGVFLGSIQFNQVEEILGYRLTEEDKKIWDKYHSNTAELKDNTFHVFHIPTCIHYKGEEAKEAILQMFTKDKLVNPTGKFRVYRMD